MTYHSENSGYDWVADPTAPFPVFAQGAKNGTSTVQKRLAIHAEGGRPVHHMPSEITARDTSTQRIPFVTSVWLCLFTCFVSTCVAQSISIPVDSARWRLEGTAKLTEYLSRPCLSPNSGVASLQDFELTDGVIDVDLAVSGARGFPGIRFRIREDGDGEEVYLRPHKTGLDDAQQYTPILNGAAVWQIYNGPGFTRVVDIPTNQWFHMRIEVTGAQARLYVGNMREPSLLINDLKSGIRKGRIGFQGPAGCFSNLEIHPTPTVEWQRREPAMPETVITQWSLSPNLDAQERDLERPLSKAETKSMKWDDVKAEPPGFVVVNRYRRSPEIIPTFANDFSKRLEPQSGMKVVYARTTIISDRDQIKKLNIGYSDDVSVFLNDTILYRGRSAQRFRDPGFLGIVNAENDAVYLPLKRGHNELVLAVSELTGGWGFICRFDDMSAIQLGAFATTK